MASYKRITNTNADVPDIRDWIYQPVLHGGFDNDHYTMNHILRRVLGKAPAVP